MYFFFLQLSFYFFFPFEFALYSLPSTQYKTRAFSHGTQYLLSFFFHLHYFELWLSFDK